MIDKYEEFKEWFEKSNYGFWKMTVTDDVVYPTFSMENLNNKKDVFDEFEKEQEEKEKEIEIKQTISYGMFDLNYYNLSIGNQKRVTTTYETLKRKELIK